MKTIILKNGYIKYPDHWVAVKNMNPSEATHCGILTFRKGIKLGIPTFLFFLKDKTVNEMDIEDEKRVYEACEMVFPSFHSVLGAQVEPQRGLNNQILNFDEWNESPEIGWFHVFDADEDQDMFTDALIYRETKQ